MNIVVVSEGPSELGTDWHKRDPLLPVPNERLGALEILVKRVAGEVYGRDIQVVALPRLRRQRVGQQGDVALAEAIVSRDLLRRLLGASFNVLEPSYRAHAAVVACDSKLARKVATILERVTPQVGGPVAHLVFDPEFEILFFEKQAVEGAKALTPCTLGPPPEEDSLRRLGKAKKALEEWLRGHCSPDARFFRQVAKVLSVPGSRPSLTKLCGDIGCLFGDKKGPPKGDQIS